MAYNFAYYAPTRDYFGRGEERNTGRYVREYGAKNVMLVYGGNSARKSGLLDLVKHSLEAEDIGFSEIGGIVPNPRLSKVYEGDRTGQAQPDGFSPGGRRRERH